MTYLRTTLASGLIGMAMSVTPGLAQTTAASWEADGAKGTFNHEFTRRLYHESLISAREWADARRGSGDQTAEFAYGTTLFFGAVEGLVADFSRYGMRRDDVIGIPFMRLLSPRNPNPEHLDYEAFRQIFERFADRMSEARTVLAAIDDPSATLSLRPAGVRLDLNGDGTYSSNERLLPIFQQITDPSGMPDDAFWEQTGAEIDGFVKRLAAGDAEALAMLDQISPPFAYDRADAAWLAGYSDLLSAFANFLLAHEFEKQFDRGMFQFFPDAETAFPKLKESASDMAFSSFIYEDRATISLVTDVVTMFLGERFEIADPARMARVRTDLLGMVEQSRISWGYIAEETDNLPGQPPTSFPEWVPGPHQNALEGFPAVTPAVQAAWMEFLDVFEAVLEGDLLLPHWRFDEGINLKAMLESPQSYSPLLIFQGTSVLPYLEEGEIASPLTLQPVTAILGADFFTYAIWFN